MKVNDLKDERNRWLARNNALIDQSAKMQNNPNFPTVSLQCPIIRMIFVELRKREPLVKSSEWLKGFVFANIQT